MHQILSYQTAMRAGNNERNVREYITRRICISFVFSVGFFTLIAGFLLGKFVSDRQHLIKQMRDERAPNPANNLQSAISALKLEAANLTKNQIEMFHPNSNTKIWFGWKDCYKISDTADYDVKVVDFTNNLVDHYVKLMNQCFNRMTYILTHIDDN